MSPVTPSTLTTSSLPSLDVALPRRERPSSLWSVRSVMSRMKLAYLERQMRDAAADAAETAQTAPANTTTESPKPESGHRRQRVHPNQMPLFTIQVVKCDTPESFRVFMEAELAHTKALRKEQVRLCNLRRIADSYVPEQLIILPPAADDSLDDLA